MIERIKKFFEMIRFEIWYFTFKWNTRKYDRWPYLLYTEWYEEASVIGELYGHKILAEQYVSEGCIENACKCLDMYDEEFVHLANIGY